MDHQRRQSAAHLATIEFPDCWQLQHFRREETIEMLFFPFYPALMLAVESRNVIDMRLWKIATGGAHAGEETHLMVSEEISAAMEASKSGS